MNAAGNETVQVTGTTAQELVVMESSPPPRTEDVEVMMFINQETSAPDILPLRAEDVKVAASADEDASETAQLKYGETASGKD